MSDSPLFEEERAWTPYEVYEAVMFRVFSSDQEWADDAASTQWDLSREEAARRLEEEDYTPPS